MKRGQPIDEVADNRNIIQIVFDLSVHTSMCRKVRAEDAGGEMEDLLWMAGSRARRIDLSQYLVPLPKELKFLTESSIFCLKVLLYHVTFRCNKWDM